MVNEKYVIFFFSIAVIMLIYSIQIINQEQLYINVNSQNRKIVNEALNGKIKNIGAIKKVGLGQGWHSGELLIYYTLGKPRKLIISEGSDYGNLEEYIRDNGYSLDNIAIVLGVTSISIIIGLIVYVKNKSK